MRRTYQNDFRYVGSVSTDGGRSHGEGFQTAPLSARRADFLWHTILKQFPRVHTPFRARRKFISGHKYVLTLIVYEDDTMLWKSRFPSRQTGASGPDLLIKKPLRGSHVRFKSP